MSKPKLIDPRSDANGLLLHTGDAVFVLPGDKMLGRINSFTKDESHASVTLLATDELPAANTLVSCQQLRLRSVFDYATEGQHFADVRAAQDAAAPKGWGMDNDFAWHWFNDGTRRSACSPAIACYWPLSISDLLPAISEQHSLKNGGSHCPKCVSMYVVQTGRRDYDNAIGDCKNCGTNFADIAEKAPGFCEYCTDNDLMPAAAPVEYQYKAPAIVAEVVRDGGLEPYRWNEHGVCVNPDEVFQRAHGKNDNLTLTAAQRPSGQWAAASGFNYSKSANGGGPGGGSGPVSLSGLGYDTKQAAVQAEAASVLLQQPRINDLHPSLRAALAVVAKSPALLVAAAPASKKRVAAKPKRALIQLDLFGGEAAA